MNSDIRPITLAAIRSGARGRSSLAWHLLLAVLGSLFVAACAQIELPMWPVPMTMQTFAVIVIGMLYGCRLGGMTLALYLAEGAAGLPVFAGYGAGLGVITGPTGGYLIGFVLAAALIGRLAERGWHSQVWSSALANLFGVVLVFFPGVLWLAVFYHALGSSSIASTGAETALGAALTVGVAPFLLGEGLKIALATIAARASQSVAQRFRD